ncbi:SURF1 family protein [Sphingomonas lacunae]|uniref:SURF1-like protein n=1 Tax=Sphingomonas lacunae TaxID=2698828 RepID=A0A6M4AR75_9SPHN|nr:SURF1 family protein [Sphingomonas lacunae]QJQ31558.1 SURF1 family protein [Sphingomonas lacunae]
MTESSTPSREPSTPPVPPNGESKLADWPIGASIVVALAIAIMIGLGIWQLGRASEKDALIARYQTNMSLPPTAFPSINPADQDYLYRTVSANCLRVTEWRELAGRTVDGRSGWRHIATCATGAEGPGILVDMGVSEGPGPDLAWVGGFVRGRVTLEPDQQSAFSRMLSDPAPLRLMIVAETPAPGLVASAPPDPSSVPSNHRSYAGQWFLFAAMAAAIFILAVLQRRRNGRG